MDKSVYAALKRIFAALLLLNTAVILIVVYLAFSNYTSQRKSLIEMGSTVLRAFEASRPMVFSSGNNTHLAQILEEMFNLDTINNIVIYRQDGKMIFSLHQEENIIKTDIHSRYIEETDDALVLYNSFHLTSMSGRGHMMSGDHMRENSVNKIFIAISINKANLKSIRNYSILTFLAAVLAELMIFFLYFRIRQVVELYEQSVTELKNAEKEAATGRLASVLAHEIKNPLSSMSGLLSFADKKCEDDKINDIINKIQDEVKRLSDIVNDFLTYGRSVELQLSLVSVNALITKTIELLKHDAAAKNISFSVSGTDFSCQADENKFLQVFVNLLLNAIDASPKSGEIKIRINQDTMKISVENETMKPVTENADKFFEPFYTTKTKGSGLGLSITKRLVELHGNSIKILNTSPFIVEINFKRNGSHNEKNTHS